MVATADQIASQAGMVAFHRGGNAVDAAIAANAAIAVTSPHLCGLGGDLFVLVHTGRSVVALNASGRSGSGADPVALRASGHSEMPFRHDIRSVTLPGCVDGWVSLHERFGSIPLADVLAPAIRIAEHGFPASPAARRLVGRRSTTPPAPTSTRSPARRRTSGPSSAGRESAGHCGPSPPTAATASTAASSPPACWTSAAATSSAKDLDRSQADWVTPLTADAFGVRLHTIPPNSQGYLTLGGARLASEFGLPDDPDDPQWAHLLIEAATAAGYDRPEVLHERADGIALLAAIEARSSLIDPQRAEPPPVARPRRRHHLSVHRRHARDGRVADPVERGRVRLVAGRAEHRHQPPQPRHRVRAPARTPRRVRPGPAASAHAVARARDARSRPRWRCSARWAATPNRRSSCNWRRACSTTVRARRPPCTPARWALHGPQSGFDTWTAPEGPVLSIEGHAPDAWRTGLAQRGHVVHQGAAYDSAYGHAHAIVIEPSGMLVGAADPRARVSAVAAI